MKRIPAMLLVFLVLGLAGCGGSSGGGDGSGTAAGATVLDSGSVQFVDLDGNIQTHNFQLVRLPNVAGGYTYVIWMPPAGRGSAGVLVYARPYAGVDWSGEAVDQRWAAQAIAAGGSYCGADVDGPDYSSGSAASICFQAYPPAQLATEASFYLSHGLGVLAVFGRFYAGGSAWNDVQDMVAALEFVRSRPEVDAGRVGVHGFSWGGFMTVYGLAYAPAGAKPAAAVAWAPATDFVQTLNHIDMLPTVVTDTVKLAEYESFYDPYLRRLFVDTGGRPVDPGADYSRFTNSALTVGIDSELLVMHDAWDTMLPYAVSGDLIAQAGATVEGFWYQHLGGIDYTAMPLSHGPLSRWTGFPSVESFTAAYLLGRLVESGRQITVVYDERDMNCFFRNIHALQQRATAPEDSAVRWLVPRLLELGDVRVEMLDVTSSAPIVIRKSGAALVAEKLNAYWGTGLTEQNVVTYLSGRNSLPPPLAAPAPGCEIN